MLFLYILFCSYVRDSLVGKSSGVLVPESILWAGRKVSLGVQAPCEHLGAFRARL